LISNLSNQRKDIDKEDQSMVEREGRYEYFQQTSAGNSRRASQEYC
jgi:hypothetical protein